MIKRVYQWVMPFYFLFLLYLMFYGFGRESGKVENIQLTHFKTISSLYENGVFNRHFLINFAANIVFFIPFGWLGFYHKIFESVIILLLTFLFGITMIELTQYFTGRGQADIDDIILNTTGMLIGFLFYKIYHKYLFKNHNTLGI